VSEPAVEYLEVGTGSEARRIAILRRPGKAPGIFWLGGYRSEMTGSKATTLDAFGAEKGLAVTRLDYSGHGQSDGDFLLGTISRWLEESLAVFALTEEPQVIVGSSMGGWLALLLARELRRRAEKAPRATLAGMVLIAPAVDFTEELMWKKFPAAIKSVLERDGVWVRPSLYDEGGYPITRKLIEEGRNHLLLGETIETGCPVRILQGVRDPDVPAEHAVELVSRLARDDVILTLVKDGDHRLSRPEDIAQLLRAIEAFE